MPTAPSRRPAAIEEEDDDLTPLPPAVSTQPTTPRPAPASPAPVVRPQNPALGNMDAPDLATRTAATKLQLGQRVNDREIGRIAERQRLEAGGGTTQGGPGMDAPDRTVRVASLKAQAGIPLTDKEVRRVAGRQQLEAANGVQPDRSITPLLSGSRLDPRGTFAQQQAQARRDEIQRRRDEIATAKQSQRDRNATLEAQMRGTGQKFYTDPHGDIQPILESGTGRALYAETPWEDGGKHPQSGEPTLIKRDRYGQRQYKQPQLVASPDLADTQLYYKFAEDDLRPAGEISKFKAHANPTVARMAKKADATRRQAMWKEAILPMEAAKTAIDSEFDQASQRVIDMQGEIDAIGQRLALIPEGATTAKSGGFLGIGGTLTPEAQAAQVQKTALEQQLAAVTTQQAALQESLKPMGEMGRRKRSADLDLKIFKAKSTLEAYDDLAEERRDILRAQGKSEEGDATLKSIEAARAAYSTAVTKAAGNAQRDAQIYAQVSPQPAPAAPEGVGTLGGIANSGQRAALQSGAAFNVLGAQNRLAKRDEYLGQAAKLEEQAANIDALQPQWSPENRAAFAQRALRSAEQLKARAAQMGESAGGEMTTAADRLKRAAAITGSAIYEGYQGAKGWDAVTRFLSDPVEISSNIAVEGGLGSLPALAMGATGAVTAGLPGAAAGAGLGSFATEYASTLTSTMVDMGVDVTDPQQISQAFTDPEVMDAARTRGLARGIPVAIFDALSGGIAGRAVAPAVGAGVGTVLRAGGREIAEQAALGMAGEAAGQVSEAVTTGSTDNLSAGDIAAEGIGEVLPGGGQVAIGAAMRRRAAQGQPPAAPQAPATVEPAPTPESPAPAAPTPEQQAAEAEFQRRLNEDQPAAPVAPNETAQPVAETAEVVAPVEEAPAETPVVEAAPVAEPISSEAPVAIQPTPESQPAPSSEPPAPVAAPEPAVVAAEAGESASAQEPVAEPQRQAPKPPPPAPNFATATTEELDAWESATRDFERNTDAQVFGDRVEEYRRLSRRANGSGPEADAAFQRVQEMENSLTPEQQDILFGRSLPEGWMDQAEAGRLSKLASYISSAETGPELARAASNIIRDILEAQSRGRKLSDQESQFAQRVFAKARELNVTPQNLVRAAFAYRSKFEGDDVFELAGVTPEQLRKYLGEEAPAAEMPKTLEQRDADAVKRRTLDLPAPAPERRPLPANARITIQEPAIPGEPRSGYQQIDLIREDGESEGSFSPDALREQGYDVPDLSALKTGQYNAGLSAVPRAVEESPREATPVAESEAPIASDKSTPDSVTGPKLDKDWTAFAPDSGTLGIPRAEMPQVASEARGALVNFLKARGITAKRTMVNPGDLKPTQAEFSEKKVDAARKHTGPERPILFSSDGHVVDGHHQWVAALDDRDTPMGAIRLDAPIDKVLAEMREFPSTESAPGATQAKAATPQPSVSQPATKLLSDRAIEALQKAKIGKPGRLLAADPIALAYDAAIDIAILGLRAGRPVEQVVRMAIDRYKAKNAKHTPENLAKLEGDIRAALSAEAAPKPTAKESEASRLPESLKSAGAPTETINYEVRNQGERRREAAAIIAKDGREKAEAQLSDRALPGDTRVAIGGQLLNERMLALKEAKPEAIPEITRDIRRITAKMQPELATEAGQTISMIGGILKDIRVAAALDYVKAATANRIEKLGGAEAEAAAQDAADALNKAKTDAEKQKAIEKLKDRYTTKPVRRMLEGLEGIDRIKELNKLGALTRDDMIEVAGNALGIPGASPDKLRRIAELSDRIESAKNHAEKSKAELELAETMQSYKGVSALDLESSMLTASILSGPTTQAANLQGNALNTLVQLATTAAVNPTRAAQLARGAIAGIPLGFQQAASILRTGRGTKDFQDFSGGRAQINPLQTVDYSRDFGVPSAAGKVLTTRARALEKVFRFMKAVDATFYYPAREAYARLAADKLLSGAYKGVELNKKVSELLHTTPESFESAKKQATDEGYTGIDLSRRVADIIEERRASTADGATATKQAEQFAAETTYTNEPVGVAGAFYRNLSKLVGEVPALKPWLMFLKTPANVFNAATNFTPLGAARAHFGVMGEKFRKGGTGEGQWRNFNADERNRLYLQSLVGTALMGGIIFQALDDKNKIDLTGKGPSDASKRRQLMQGGWRPYSLKVGDRWFSYRDSPLLIPLSIAGNFTDAVRYEGAKKKEDLGKKAALAAARFPETIFQTSMLTGIADLMSALSGKGGGPEGITRTLGSLPANMAIPYNRMLQQIDQSFDEQTYDNPPAVGSVPFARRTGTPQTDVQGRPQKYDPWGRFSSADSGDAVDTFIREKNVFIPEVGKDTKIGKETMTEAQLDAYRRISGQRIRIRMQSLVPRLRSLSAEKAQDEVDRIAREEREKVKPLIRAGVGVRK